MMKEFFVKHIIFIVGIVLLIALPKVFATLGLQLLVLCLFFGVGIAFLIINVITFILCLKNFDSKTNTCEVFAILLSILGGGIGSKLSTTLFGNTPSSDDVEVIYHYCCELDLFIFVVCPIFALIADGVDLVRFVV